MEERVYLSVVGGSEDVDLGTISERLNGLAEGSVVAHNLFVLMSDAILDVLAGGKSVALKLEVR